jgi:membrane-associated phospholipid phosphatase
VLYGALFTLLLGLIINLTYKISLHTLAWGATVASLAGISLKMMIDIPGIIISAVLLSGLVGFARLKLNAHNPSQVYLGWIAGVSIILILTFVF